MDVKKEEIIVVVLAIVLFLGFILFVKPSTTGFVIHTPSNYIYNSSAINLSDNEVKLIPIITTQTTATTTQTSLQLTAATQDGDDKLSKVSSLGNGDVSIEEDEQDEILDLTFGNNLQNYDIISVYVKHNKATSIKICNPLTLCSDPYATANYDGNPKLINFTLSNLNSSRNTFGIFPTQEKIKVDYVYATYFTTTTNTTTTISYPSSSSIETQNINPTNISRFDYINYTHTLNDQRIDYFYSLNSGSSWINLSDKNISSLNISTIKIKAVLNSDTIQTPVLNSLYLLYTELIQEQNLTNATQSNQTQINSSNSTQTFTRRVFLDSVISLDVFSNTNLSDANINLVSSNLNYSNKEKVKAVEILSQNISFDSATLRINYSNSELTNINESTIKLYYYNETLNSWEELNAVVDTQENYVLYNLTHFSVYGIFGNSNDVTSPSSGGGGGSSSSGRGGSDNAPSQVVNREVKASEIVPQNQEQKVIKLFDTKSTEETKKDKDEILEGITTQAVKEVTQIKTMGIYAFVALVFILYFIYHKHVKKANSKQLKIKRKA